MGRRARGQASAAARMLVLMVAVVMMLGLAAVTAGAQEQEQKSEPAPPATVSVELQQAARVDAGEGKQVLELAVAVEVTPETTPLERLSARLVGFTGQGEQVLSPVEHEVSESSAPGKGVLRFRFEDTLKESPYLMLFVGVPRGDEQVGEEGLPEGWGGVVITGEELAGS